MTGEPISPRRLGESATPAEGLSMPAEGRSRGRSRVARRRSRVEGGDARIEHTCLAVSAVIKIRDPRVASLYLRPEDLTYDIPAGFVGLVLGMV